MAVKPCLVYVAGPRGPEPQIWHDPLVTEAGKLAVKPVGIEIVAGPVQLKDNRNWTVGLAEASTGSA